MTAKATSHSEGRPRPLGTLDKDGQGQTQGWCPRHELLVRVNDAARRSRQTRFTALLHHIDVAALERAFRRLKRKAAPGVDGMTVADYEQDLESYLRAPAHSLGYGRNGIYSRKLKILERSISTLGG